MRKERLATKVQEIVAHREGVNCLSVSRHSGALLATGGEDAAVNLWAIDRPGAIASLSGHTAAVTCVCFDDKEEHVLTGSKNATMKLFENETGKAVRSVTGHRQAITALDFHMLGQFFASGSQDTNSKLWDRRQRSCVATFRGHQEVITQVHFSPDGRWLVTGSDDCYVKLWDLTAGKQIADLKHAAPVVAAEFNPAEFVLATASKDRCVRFWDMDTFETIDTCGPEAVPASAAAFHPDGKGLLAAYPDCLRVHGYEPAATYDVVDVAWPRVADMAVVGNGLVSAAVTGKGAGSKVQIWALDLTSVRVSDEGPVPSKPLPRSNSGDQVEAGGIKALARGAQVDAGNGRGDRNAGPARRPESSRPSSRAASGQSRKSDAEKGEASVEAVGAQMAKATVQPKDNMKHASTGIGASLERGAPAPAAVMRVPSARSQLPPDPDAPPSRGEIDADVLSATRLLDDKHGRVLKALRTRTSNLEVVTLFWVKGDVKGCMMALVRSKDAVLAADVFRKICDGPDSMSKGIRLEMCPPAVEAIRMCLASLKNESNVKAGLAFTNTLLHGFRKVILENLGQPSGGADLKADERRQRSREARDAFGSLMPLILPVCDARSLSSATRRSAREANERIEQLRRVRD